MYLERAQVKMSTNRNVYKPKRLQTEKIQSIEFFNGLCSLHCRPKEYHPKQPQKVNFRNKKTHHSHALRIHIENLADI